MRRFFIFFLFCFFIFSSALFSKDRIYSSWGSAIKGYDVVAYFTQNKALKGSSLYEYTYLGARFRFVSAAHLALFKSNPGKYIPQYGGYCAYAMSKGEFVSISPSSFYILNDKLYLNYNEEIKQKWLLNKDQFISKANAFFSSALPDLN